MYEFFQLRDYLEVTPVWLEPTAFYLMVPGYMLLILSPFIFKDKDPGRVKMRMYNIWFWSLILAMGGTFLIAILWRTRDANGISFVQALSGYALIFAAWFGFHYATTIVDRLGPLAPTRKAVRIVIYACTTSLFVAFSVGYSWTPQWIALSKESTVIVGDANGDMKEKEIHGKIVLHLERYLLLQDKSGDLVAISTSQIKRIDSAKLF